MFVNDLKSGFRSHVQFNNRKKLFNNYDKSYSLVLTQCIFTMVSSDNLIDSITVKLGRKELDFLSRRQYPIVLKAMIDLGILYKPNNNNSHRIFYVNPNFHSVLNSEQSLEIKDLYFNYFK